MGLCVISIPFPSTHQFITVPPHKLALLEELDRGGLIRIWRKRWHGLTSLHRHNIVVPTIDFFAAATHHPIPLSSPFTSLTGLVLPSHRIPLCSRLTTSLSHLPTSQEYVYFEKMSRIFSDITCGIGNVSWHMMIANIWNTEALYMWVIKGLRTKSPFMHIHSDVWTYPVVSMCYIYRVQVSYD